MTASAPPCPALMLTDWRFQNEGAAPPLFRICMRLPARRVLNEKLSPKETVEQRKLDSGARKVFLFGPASSQSPPALQFGEAA
eukprot:9480103-Pyramimonas_sp.AAC.1